jgi:tetratricopeptide (TPR) repeat protein
MVNTAKQKDANYALTYYRMGEMYLLEGKKTQAAAAFKDYIRLEPNSRLAKDAASLMNAGPAPGAAQNKPVSTVKPEDAVKPNGQNPATPATPNKPATNPPGQHPAQPPAGQHPAQPPAAHGATPAHPAAPAHQPPAQVKPPEPPPPPPLTGDALYEDRLSRGRQARAIGDADNAVNLLKEAYGVHPDYSQVNYELGLAYIAASDPCDGKKYLERYLQLETDADAKAQAQEKLNGVVCDEPDN